MRLKSGLKKDSWVLLFNVQLDVKWTPDTSLCSEIAFFLLKKYNKNNYLHDYWFNVGGLGTRGVKVRGNVLSPHDHTSILLFQHGYANI